MKRIRIEMRKPGEGSFAYEYEHCPIYFAVGKGNDICPLDGMVCKFGLTEISPPDDCPIIRCRDVTFVLSVVGVEETS